MEQRMKSPNWKSFGLRMKTTLTKFRLPLVLFALGAAILAWPSGNTDREMKTEQAQTQADPSGEIQGALQALLSRIDGVGRAELMLTTTASEEIFYQTDVRVSGDTREETTVFSSGQSAQKTPIVTKTEAAPYLGAVVVCDGADSAAVRLRVIQAVSALTGLGSDKISVIKMKRQ